MTETEILQKAWHEYEKVHGNIPVSARDAVQWAVRERLIDLPKIDPYDVLAQRMSRALREEYDTDEHGRRYRVNHAIRVTRDGVQYTFWATMGFAPHQHMQMAFTQRREQIIGDCVQLKTDVDVYNAMNKTAEPIQLILDFSDDVAEKEVAKGIFKIAA